MLTIHSFTFSPFAENTYLIISPSRDCIVVDPGMYDTSEKAVFDTFVKENSLNPVLLWNTHAHLDHVFGNAHVFDKYQLKARLHPLDMPTLASSPIAASMYGLNFENAPEPIEFFEDFETIEFGGSKIEVKFTPGHAPGHVVFYLPEEKFVVGGDVLFENSIGRTDLPGGDAQTLRKSIENVMFQLPDETTVYSGHGGATTIGNEKAVNPYVNAAGSGLLQRE